MFNAVGLLPREMLGRAEARTSRPLSDLTDRVDPGRDHFRGPADAPVTLVEYGDYECPHCGRAAPVVAELLTRFPNQLRFVFRHLPLTDVHPNAALAAQAAEAAGAQGRFWEMHDLLFAHQDDLDPHDLSRYAGELDLDVAAFTDDLRSGRFGPHVAQDVNSAEEAGVAGTPSFFVNEVRYRGAYDVETMATLVRRVLRLVEGRAQLEDELSDAEAEPGA